MMAVCGYEKMAGVRLHVIVVGGDECDVCLWEVMSVMCACGRW